MPTTTDRAAWAEAARICACFNLRRAARAVTRLFDEILEPGGVSATQFASLVVIYVEGAPTLPRLAKTLGVDRSTLTRTLKTLARAGHVRSQVASRTASVRLTPKGERTLLRCLPLWKEAQGRFESSVGSDNWRSILDGLSAVVAAVPDA